MEVIKRSTRRQAFNADKIRTRLEKLAKIDGLAELVIDIDELVAKVNSGVCNNITTSQLDDLCAEVCASKNTVHPDYSTMALRLTISNLHKQTLETFSEKMTLLFNNNVISNEMHEKVLKHGENLDKVICYKRDYLMNYFGLKTLMNSYLYKIDRVVIERPQDMIMRVSLFIHDDIEKIITSYNYISQRYFTHATPTLFNAGSLYPQLSSCFLLDMIDDNIDGVYKTLRRCALISKCSGGIGVNIHKIRATGSKIVSTNGISNGIVPMLKVFDSTARYVDQGGNKRPGSIAIYLEPWHADIFEFLDLRKNTGLDEMRTRNLFLGLWIPDLFMERVEKDGQWSLFCPNEAYIEIYEDEKISDALSRIERERIKNGDLTYANQETSELAYSESSAFKDKAESKSQKKGIYDRINKIRKLSSENKENCRNKPSPDQANTSSDNTQIEYPKRVNLSDVYGDDFRILYEHFESSKVVRKKLNAQMLWKAIIEAQIETGNPYMLYKDACNTKNNQKNLGVLRGSNLCTEILEYTSKDEVAVCNLASIGLPLFIKKVEHESMNENHLGKVFSDNKYDVDGQSYYFDYDELSKVAGVLTENLNKIIDVNYYPLKEAENSNKRHRPIGIGVQGLADVFAILKLPFESENARKINKRIFETIYYGAINKSIDIAKEEGRYSSYTESPTSEGKLQFDLWNHTDLSYDWSETRDKLSKYGLRNSLLIAPMPTASTSQILGFNECFEPFTSNIYSRRTLAGDFQMVNKYMLEDLVKLKLWTPEIKNLIVEHEGSIQKIEGIPEKIKQIYKTAWEISMRSVIDMAADRAPFIDQSQSLNLFVGAPTYSKLTSMHFYGWRKGLKTGMYYLRTKPIGSAYKFTVDKESVKAMAEGSVCKMEDGCLSCSG